MKLTLITAPTEEPVSVDEAKKHCNIDITEDDAYVASLIVAARQHVENTTGIAMLTQTWKLSLDEFPCADEIALPKYPLQTVTKVEYYALDKTVQTFDPTLYEVDAYSHPPEIELAPWRCWPADYLRSTNGVEITFVCGYLTTTEIPRALTLAMLLLIGHWYAHREAVSAERMVTPTALPMGFDALTAPYRLYA